MIHLGDASVIKAEGLGTLAYLMDTPTGVVKGIIPDTLYVPALAATLLSVSQFTSQNHKLMFEDNNCFVHSTTTNRCVAHAVKTTSGLYRLLACPSLSIQYANLARSSTHIDINLLHHHLGHLSHDNVKQLVDKGMVQGVVSVGGRIDLCEACIHGC